MIGVLPAWFHYPNAAAQLWTPVHVEAPENEINTIDSHNFRAFGRLRPGVSESQAAAELTVITRRMHDQHLDDPFVCNPANIRPLLDSLVSDIKTPLYVLLAANGCVLLIACLNVANLLVARAAARRKEQAIRSGGDVTQFSAPIQRIVADMDHDLPVSGILTMDQIIGRDTSDASFDATLLIVFAGLSLLLAAVGLFGVLSYIVAQRISEIGIRIALGAPREQGMRKILVDGLKPALVGLALGLAASAGAVRLLQSMLYGTKPLDPTVFAAVSATLLLVAALACALPAWRASRLDPMQALRTE